MGTNISEESAATTYTVQFEDEGSKFLQNVGTYLPKYAA
jgi:hypothetical protein